MIIWLFISYLYIAHTGKLKKSLEYINNNIDNFKKIYINLGQVNIFDHAMVSVQCDRYPFKWTYWRIVVVNDNLTIDQQQTAEKIPRHIKAVKGAWNLSCYALQWRHNGHDGVEKCRKCFHLMTSSWYLLRAVLVFNVQSGRTQSDVIAVSTFGTNLHVQLT